MWLLDQSEVYQSCTADLTHFILFCKKSAPAGPKIHTLALYNSGLEREKVDKNVTFPHPHMPFDDGWAGESRVQRF